MPKISFGSLRELVERKANDIDEQEWAESKGVNYTGSDEIEIELSENEIKRLIAGSLEGLSQEAADELRLHAL